MKIYLDDVRQPQDCIPWMKRKIGTIRAELYNGKWEIVRNYKEFIKMVDAHYDVITHVSFDHDLAEEHYVPEEYWKDYKLSEEYQNAQNYKEKTGEDCAKWMKEFYNEYKLTLPNMFVHSMNPVGAQKIINVFK